MEWGPPQRARWQRTDRPASERAAGGAMRGGAGRSGGLELVEEPDAPKKPPLWRRILGILCVLGIPIASTASTEYGQFIETRIAQPYKKGYAIAWLNHSVLIIYLVPWAAIVMAERGCSCRELWRAMVAPYGSTRRFVGVTFWLAFQYQLFNCAPPLLRPRGAAPCPNPC